MLQTKATRAPLGYLLPLENPPEGFLQSVIL